MKNLIEDLIDEISKMDTHQKIETINYIKEQLHEISPFKNEPVDCVVWVKNETVFANSYNPNNIPGPEFKLLNQSIESDGYTQPIVTMQAEIGRETIDGYHRGVVGKTNNTIKDRIFGYLPVVSIKKNQEAISDRMASTIRHNKARGNHSIELMSNIVTELTQSGMGDAWILKHIGMDADELLRLKQITGLAALFTDNEFSETTYE